MNTKLTYQNILMSLVLSHQQLPAHCCAVLCCPVLPRAVFPREKSQNMLLLSSDVNRVEAWSVDFLVNHTKLIQVVTDGGGNISVMQYDKGVSHTGGGVGAVNTQWLSVGLCLRAHKEPSFSALCVCVRGTWHQASCVCGAGCRSCP